MTRRMRFVVLAAGCIGMVILFVFAVRGMPGFGGDFHPYRDRAAGAALRHATANVVSSVNFDLRALDTLGEELILLGSVAGAASLLRPGSDETASGRGEPTRVLGLTEVAGYLLLPITMLVGADVFVHSHLTPGGGFQAGVILATGLHLLYIVHDYPALQRLRPLSWYSYAEALGAASYVMLGLAGIVGSSVFLANVLPVGQLGTLASGGSVGLLSFAVGCSVGAGMVVLLAQFLRQAIVIVPSVDQE